MSETDVLSLYDFTQTTLTRLILLLSVFVLIRCVTSLFRGKREPEVWAVITCGGQSIPVTHWEAVIGRSFSADVRIRSRGVRRVHAILKRDDAGGWTIYDVFNRGETAVNGKSVEEDGRKLTGKAEIRLGSETLHFEKASPSRTAGDVSVGNSPWITLVLLTLLQIAVYLEHLPSIRPEYAESLFLVFVMLIALEWAGLIWTVNCGCTGYEVETIAFYLTTLGLSVTVSSVPKDLFKQGFLIFLSVAAYVLCGLFLRKVRHSESFRRPAMFLTPAILFLNLILGQETNGALNWLSVGGLSIQPSELVKVLYVFVGASALDQLYRRRDLLNFIVFSAVCVGALALMGDFGTALVFFVAFLVISFMRSGSIATVLLSVSGAGMAGFLAVNVKPYIARRFAAWGHVWEDPFDTGYQQTRAMAAAASGGLFGKGAGRGWLKGVVASNTDMVFCFASEEYGLIVAVVMVLAVLALAVFTVKTCRTARTSTYSIASCAVMAMLLTQVALNVFGTLDLLPFTGVTFPFVSRGGTSLLSCWIMMAFLKANDMRSGKSIFVTRAGSRGR